MEESIFTKIIKGTLPSYKLYEDEKTLAFLDIHPLQPGHTLVIPKTQIDHLWDLPDEDYQALMATCKKVALHLRQQLGVKRVGIQVIGLDVPHAHVQLVPFDTAEQYHAAQDLNGPVDHEQLAALADKLAIK